MPVILSVPHAGRAYPPELLADLRVPPDRLRLLEDRHADRLIDRLDGGVTALVARMPRAWIDLNRGEGERDPLLEVGLDRTRTAQLSAKVRGGLGIVPRRLGRDGDLWRRRLSTSEVDRRIADHHRPYHAALADALGEARRRFGIAILLDLHSMPPLDGDRPARVVIGDRFGRSAHGSHVARVEDAARHAGLQTALNSPYAGGHILDRHGDPARGVHALQLELDRTLYLDAALDRPTDGMAGMADLITDIVATLADGAQPVALAAE